MPEINIIRHSNIDENFVLKQIQFIRGKKVLLDHSLANLYGVKTYRLNEAVRRNLKRFPADFMFRITAKEKQEVIANCDILSELKFSAHLPYAFTEQGVAMLSSVLNINRAIEVNIQIMRTFSKIREMISAHTELRQKIEALEKKYDSQFKIVFDALRQLLAPPKKPKRQIGFHQL